MTDSSSGRKERTSTLFRSIEESASRPHPGLLHRSQEPAGAAKLRASLGLRRLEVTGAPELWAFVANKVPSYSSLRLTE